MLIDTEEFKHKLNNSKYYGTEVWDDICNMLSECTSYTLNTEEDDDNRYCPYYTTRMETRILSDEEICEVYRLSGQIKRTAEYTVGYCMGTRELDECYCNGLKERCEHK